MPRLLYICKIFSDFLCFDMSLLFVTVTLRGYLISIAYCLIFICFVVATFDQVHNVDAINHHPKQLTASGNVF